MNQLDMLFKGMVEYHFHPSAAVGWNVIIQYHITGDGGADYYIVISGPNCLLHKGVSSNPSLTITVNIDDWFAIAEGRVSGQDAFLDGRMSVTGNLNDLFRLLSVFSRI